VSQATDAAGASPKTSASNQGLVRKTSTDSVRPSLSICIITYNRVQFLDSLLQRLTAAGVAGLSYEIVLCDNCSTDATMDVATRWAQQHPQIRYFRQAHNVGALNNLLTAYRLAHGTYAIYLADDDLLIPEAVAETITYLDLHPEVVVAHAPWEMWDDVAKQAQGLFYRVDETQVFNRGEALALANFVVEQHIFPEICIYRTAALHRMYVAPSVGFWAFVYLAVSLNFGQVAFLKRPFYRSVTRHSVGLDREQMGVVDVLNKLDSYRAGLEVLINAAYRFQGLPGVPPARIEIVQRMIRNFIAVRVQVAIRFLKQARNFTAAAQYLSRLQVAGAISDDLLAAERQQLAGPMLGQTIIELCSGISLLSEVVLCDVEGAQSSIDMLRALKPELSVHVASLESLLVDGLPAAALVLTSYPAQRERLIEAGYPSGLVVSEQELLSVFGVY
jgi:glycosyltransferase involved in cell wall biosynthesis